MKKNLVGKKFGKLQVLELAFEKEYISSEGKRRTENWWKCKCDCGKEVIRVEHGLLGGRTKSCGCNKQENINKLIKYNKENMYKEGTNLNKLKCKVNKNNQTGIRGVTLDKNNNKYKAILTFKGKTYNLGAFNNIEDAIKVRKEAEEKYYKPILEKYNYKNEEIEEEFE